MRSINKVILIGNLTRDPEMRQTGGGQNVVTFGLATNREWVTRDGRRQDLAEFHELVAWAKLADICAKYLRKGKLVYVEGYLKTRSWDTPEGTKKYRTEIVVQDMIMLEKRTEGGFEDYIPEDSPSQNAENTEPSDSGNMEELTTRKKTYSPKPKEEPVAASAAAPAPSTAPVDIDSDLGL
ncbi:MAG TPA: single-stranded DNA-binding protein [Candidatus Gracilibacteria bacterium]|nr:single-stranded DNA-binding protein [Candidatus Gracilibacteria bacterium]